MPAPPSRLYLFGMLLFVVAGLKFGTAFFGSEPTTPDASDPNFPSAVSNSSPRTDWSRGPEGASENAKEHWLKHGEDFPEFSSEQEYEHGALAFVRHPPPGTLIKHRPNGDTLLYNPETNTFAVSDRRGMPRTFFRPNSQKAYWDRQ